MRDLTFVAPVYNAAEFNDANRVQEQLYVVHRRVDEATLWTLRRLMNDDVRVVNNSVLWESPQRVVVQVAITTNVVNSCFLIAYSYLPRLGMEPEMMSRSAAHHMQRILCDLDFPVVNITKQYWHPALIVCDCTSRRQLRSINAELHRVLFRPVTWMAYASDRNFRLTKRYLLRCANRIVDDHRSHHLSNHRIIEISQTNTFTSTSYEAGESFLQRARMLHKLGYSETVVTPSRTVTHVHLCLTTTFVVE